MISCSISVDYHYSLHVRLTRVPSTAWCDEACQLLPVLLLEN